MSDCLSQYEGLVLGYYPLRGKMQVCRLLCEYLHLSYKDLFFTPQSWEEFKRTQSLKWNYQQLPFLKDKELIVTETYPICLYILHKANRKDLLGTNIQDEAKVDMFLWQTELMCQLLCLMTSSKIQTKEIKAQVQAITQNWNSTLKGKFVNLQNQCSSCSYLPYLTLVDFYIYDLLYFFKVTQLYDLLNCETEFPKLTKIYERISKIPEIKNYQTCNRAIKSVCPAEFCNSWREKCLKDTNNTNKNKQKEQSKSMK